MSLRCRVSGRDEGDDLSSIVSEALSSSVKTPVSGVKAKKTKKKKKRSQSPSGVPMSISTTPTNAQLKEQKNRVKRDSAKEDLTLLANAALVDEANDAEFGVKEDEFEDESPSSPDKKSNTPIRRQMSGEN